MGKTLTDEQLHARVAALRAAKATLKETATDIRSVITTVAEAPPPTNFTPDQDDLRFYEQVRTKIRDFAERDEFFAGIPDPAHTDVEWRRENAMGDPLSYVARAIYTEHVAQYERKHPTAIHYADVRRSVASAVPGSRAPTNEEIDAEYANTAWFGADRHHERLSLAVGDMIEARRCQHEEDMRRRELEKATSPETIRELRLVAIAGVLMLHGDDAYQAAEAEVARYSDEDLRELVLSTPECNRRYVAKELEDRILISLGLKEPLADWGTRPMQRVELRLELHESEGASGTMQAASDHEAE